MIRYIGPIGIGSGYSRAAMDNIMALLEAGAELDVWHTGQEGPSWTNGMDPRYGKLEEARRRYYLNDWPKTVVVHAPPTHLRRVSEGMPASVNKVCYTTWGTFALPKYAVEQVNTFDLIIVPSTWNRDIFRSSGVDESKVVVVPHCFDPKWWWSEGELAVLDAPLATGPYTFITSTLWNWHKNPLGVLTAYFSAFTADDNVLLRLICPNVKLEEISLLKKLMNLQATPALEVYGGEKKWIDHDVYRHLFRASDCYVTTTRGDGWGIGAMEAAVCGLPTIYTKCLGAHDLLQHDGYSHPIAYQLTPCVNPPSGVEGIDGQQNWAEPSLSRTKVFMKDTYEKDRRRGIPIEECREYTYAAIGRRLRQVLESL